MFVSRWHNPLFIFWNIRQSLRKRDERCKRSLAAFFWHLSRRQQGSHVQENVLIIGSNFLLSWQKQVSFRKIEIPLDWAGWSLNYDSKQIKSKRFKDTKGLSRTPRHQFFLSAITKSFIDSGAKVFMCPWNISKHGYACTCLFSHTCVFNRLRQLVDGKGALSFTPGRINSYQALRATQLFEIDRRITPTPPVFQYRDKGCLQFGTAKYCTRFIYIIYIVHTC